jgi:hypothetical protein
VAQDLRQRANAPITGPCKNDRSKCDVVAVGKTGDLLSDENSTALELTINRKNEADEKVNLIQLGTLEAGSKQARVFFISTPRSRSSLTTQSDSYGNMCGQRPTGLFNSPSMKRVI